MKTATTYLLVCIASAALGYGIREFAGTAEKLTTTIKQLATQMESRPTW